MPKVHETLRRFVAVVVSSAFRKSPRSMYSSGKVLGAFCKLARRESIPINEFIQPDSVFDEGWGLWYLQNLVVKLLANHFLLQCPPVAHDPLKSQAERKRKTYRERERED